jgi:hypothetical protein
MPEVWLCLGTLTYIYGSASRFEGETMPDMRLAPTEEAQALPDAFHLDDVQGLAANACRGGSFDSSRLVWPVTDHAAGSEQA